MDHVSTRPDIPGLRRCCDQWTDLQKRGHHFLFALYRLLSKDQPIQTFSHATRSLVNTRRLLLEEIEISLVDVKTARTKVMLRMQKIGREPGWDFAIGFLE